uniref:Protein phosphatase 4 regulatory subunit 3C n=1 Tax=Otolemur garnettii TaxID=30611 RepID=H0XRW3_OTOGA
MEDDKRYRVRVYVLKENQQWDEIGAGQISATYVEELRDVFLLVRSESDSSLILESRIQPNTIYQKQQGTVIVWSEEENHGLALSFEDADGCREIWEDICHIQGKDPTIEITQALLSELREQISEMPDIFNIVELPDCELDTLGQIADLINSILASADGREKMAVILESDDYIKKLLQLFRACEILQNMKSLHYLHEIIKGILCLNKTPLTEVMFSDECILDVVGCLEYDPAFPEPKRYREFLTQNAKFKEVIPIADIELRQKIHQTYRAQFIYDILLPVPTVFDENYLSTITTFIFFNKVEIVSMLQGDDKFLTEVFAQLKDKTTSDDKRYELLSFFKEFCNFSRTLQPQSKDALFKTLTHLGILPVLKIIMSAENLPIRSTATDIFAYIIEYNPSLIRKFAIEEARKGGDHDFLINIVISQMICDTDPELAGAIHLMEIIRALLDPETMVTTSSKCERSEFLNFFYKRCMNKLVAPLMATTSEEISEEENIDGSNENITSLNYQRAHLLSLIVELLSFCVQHHTYYIKNYIFNKDLLRKVLILMKSKHTFVILCAIRFMRNIVGLKDEFYNRYIIKGNFLEPVVTAFLDNGTRYNMLNSAIIEMFDYIRVENIKSLVAHIMENYYKSLEEIEYVQTFKGLKVRYEQEKERQKKIRKNLHCVLGSKLYRKRAKILEVKEETYSKAEEEDDDVMPPLEDEIPDYYEQCTHTKEREKEDKVDTPQRTSSGSFEVSSTCSADPENTASSPSDQRVV